MRNIMAAVILAAFCADLYAGDGETALSQIVVAGSESVPAAPVPTGAGFGAPCYLTEGGCDFVSSFYIARRWRLKNEECSKIVGGLATPHDIGACERMKAMIIHERDGKTLLDSELDSACNEAHPKFHRGEFRSIGFFKKYYGLELSTINFEKEPEELVGIVNKLAAEYRDISVKKCKQSWFTPNIEVNYDPTGRRRRLHNEDMLLPICAEGKKTVESRLYHGSAKDTYNMELQIGCTLSNGMWTVDNMELRIDEPKTTTRTESDGNNHSLNATATLTIIPQVLTIGGGYTYTETHAVSYGYGTSRNYGTPVVLEFGKGLPCGSKIDVCRR